MIGINLLLALCQLCEKYQLLFAFLFYPQADARPMEKNGLQCVKGGKEKRQFEAGTEGIRSFLRVNLFSFFSSNYKVYISFT